MATSLKVAVIGAGVAGLTAARELQRESHKVVLFEKSHRLGGTWAYDPRVESDLLGVDPNRDVVHASLYESLRTNLPRRLMSFTDFKFSDKVYHDPRTFPSHDEVLSFLEDFASKFELTKLIRFNTMVTQVEVVDSGTIEFVVKSKTSGVSSLEKFDAVVVCNGHNTEPRLATDIPGIETWSKKQMHSHNYRVPEPFRDQIVVIIGGGASAMDISRDIAKVAKEVHMSSRSPLVNISKLDKFDNVWQHSKVNCISTEGTITFQDGFSTEADIILHCTGYNYHVPFLNQITLYISTTSVLDLYTNMFSPQNLHQDSLLLEYLKRWIAQTLSKRVLLPSEDEMLRDVDEYHKVMKENGIPEHHTHSLGFKTYYLDWMFAQSGMVMENDIQDMVEYLIRCLKIAGLTGYMDLFLQKYGM